MALRPDALKPWRCLYINKHALSMLNVLNVKVMKSNYLLYVALIVPIYNYKKVEVAFYSMRLTHTSTCQCMFDAQIRR